MFIGSNNNNNNTPGLDENDIEKGTTASTAGKEKEHLQPQYQQKTKAQLEAENEILRSKVASFERAFSRMVPRPQEQHDIGTLLQHMPQDENQAMMCTPIKDRKQNGSGETVVNNKLSSSSSSSSSKRKRRRRRWSLSNVRYPFSEVSNLQRELDGDTSVLFHDELDAHTSGNGLHHRKGVQQQPQQPRRKAAGFGSSLSRPLVRNASDDFSDEVTEEDDSLFSSSPLMMNHSEQEYNSEEEDDECASNSFWVDLKDRANWLVGLMILQSLSSFIIKRNEEMLEEHIIIVQFLTMLVGAGGNAGNQASVRVIRGLALGSITDRNLKKYLWSEFRVGLLLAAILGVSGCVRAAIFGTPLPETLAITTSLVTIVLISISIGSILPVGMKYAGIDPAHSSTSIQVIMDILGVTITVHVSKLFVGIAYRWVNGA
ncbi:hypothetical protein ACA910_016793 [Epithemia clementina (nom. ined.)]